MFSIGLKMLFALAVAGWVQPAMSRTSSCATGEVSPVKLRVTIPPEKRQDFIKLLQSENDPIALGASYVGSAESSSSLSIDFLEVIDKKTSSKISIQADNKKPSSLFDFSFWSCNTTRDLEPYREGVRNRVTLFGATSAEEFISR